MTTAGLIVIAAMVFAAIASAVIGAYGVRARRSTSDFVVAARTVRPVANAAAISGEYLSAASFLGVAGLILRDGVDALWYPVGFAAGYLALVFFVVAPLRRSGAYAVPDFAEARLHSPMLRRLCTAVVVIIGWLYLLPQLQGAGLTLTTATGLPYWLGAVAAAVVVVGTVLIGGMRSVTFVQAFQYWLKFSALAIPTVVALVYFFGDHRTFNHPAPPTLTHQTTVWIHTGVTLQVTRPITLTATGRVDGVQASGTTLRWNPGLHSVADGAVLEFPAGTTTPVVEGAPADDATWLLPNASGDPYSLLGIYSLLLATFLGTMGLPHVLVRFYTNPDGRAARRTAVFVLALIGIFYLAVTAVGALSRLYTPQLLISGETDAAVLLLPQAVLGSGPLGVGLGAVVAAGAWATFLATSSGLVVSVAGVLAADVFSSRRTGAFRMATVIGGAVPLVLSLLVTRMEFGEAVALVFAMAASTFCPLLVLGIWWRGLTAAGAAAGVAVGGVLAGGAIGLSLAGITQPGWIGVLMLRPALVSVPAAALTMLVVSLFTASSRPAGVDQLLLRLHAPERLGLSRDRPAERLRGPAA
ncbi:MAG TPA: cation acetate symporter [Pseudonocardia sp.]